MGRIPFESTKTICSYHNFCRNVRPASVARYFSFKGTNNDDGGHSSPTLSDSVQDDRSPTIGESTASSATNKESVESILRAPFKTVQPCLFPWRHDAEPLPRLVPGSPEAIEKGYLLGGDVQSSNPKLDALATAWFFLRVPWYNLLFFRRAWEADLAESMSWAFLQAVSAILSNTYQIPLENISKGGDKQLSFQHSVRGNSSADEEGSARDSVVGDDVERMVESHLLKIFQAAKEFGNESIRVRLEIKPTLEPAEIVSLFVFPFLSRDMIKKRPNRRKKYNQMLELMAVDGSSREAMSIVHEFMEEFQQDKVTESTVICQVLIPFDEVFCVKDAETGRLIQGHGDEKFRRVLHLVRFEQVVRTRLVDNGRFLPLKLEPGNWQITDIDDLLDGNLLV